MEKLPLFEERKQELLNKIETVKQNAITFDRANELMLAIDHLKSQEERGDILEEIALLKSEINESTVTVQTLPEFKVLLENADLDAEGVLNVLEHENAHANVAEAVEAKHLGYSLLITKNGDGFMYGAWARFSHPTEWFTNEKKEDIKRIFNAPAEYGNSLSEDDKKNIEELEKGN